MTRANEFTPLLVGEEDVFRPPGRRRNVWQLVLTGALSLGVLSLFQQRRSPVDVSVDVADAIVSLETEDAAFLSSMEAYKDPSVDPCVDFYQYACGGWLSSHEIPSDRPSIDASFYVVSETNKDTIQRIFEQKPPQINQLYQSCLNDQEVDATAVAFVAELIENVHLANSTIALMEYAGEMDQSLGISSFFSLFVGADPQDPSINVLQLAQGGLTLPSREYYLEESKVEAYAELFVDYVTKLFAVEDLDKHNVSEYAHAVLETETNFAKISLPNAALRNPWTTSTAYPFADIAQRYPFLMAYLNGIYKNEPFPMLHAIVATPDFFEAQNELLKDELLLPQLKNYLSFHLIDSFGAILGEYFRRASHEFHGTIQGAGALLPRDQFCVRLTTTFLGDEIGEYYVKDVFGPDAKAAAQALVAEIEESLKALLTTEAWLDKVTYEAAVAKLEKVKNYIGGPDEVPPLPFALQADAFFNNVKSLMQLGATGTIQAINEPVNEQAWDMFPSTVNAYYDPSANKMVFPAAILQPPFYSAEHFPAAANFARIGMVMGHELSHGFDDQGRNYDGNGALRSWWTPSVSAEFAQKAQCLAAQYSNFPVVSIEDDHVLGTVNGNLTLGENIADNGGIHLAYEAYQLWKSTFAPPPGAPSSPTDEPSNDTPEPTESAPAPMPAETVPTPEPTETIPVAVSPPEVQPPEPTPNEDTPAVTLDPVVPIPDVPVPEPTETGPGEQIPAVTLPPPVLPVPEAETPEPVQTSPSGEIPVGTPPVVPEPQPDIGPGEVIPEETLPAPTQTAPPAESPVVTLPPSPGPTPEQQTPVPSEPPSEVSTSPPVVPVPVPVPEPTHEPPTSSPPVKTKPTDATPNPVATEASPDKHKHKNEKDEPKVKEPSVKSKHHEGESEKDKTHEKTKPKDKESVKHPSDKKKEKEEKKEHGDGNEDEGEKSSKHSGKRSKDEEDGKHEKHRHEDDSEAKGDDKSKHKKRDDSGDEKDESEGHREKDKHGHENDDSNHDEDETKHHHEKQEEEGHGRRGHENKRERRRRDEEKEEEDHGGKHHGRWEDEEDRDRWEDEEDRDRWEDEKDHDRHYMHGHSDEEEDGQHRHGRHGSKEERREERRERREERREEEEKRKEERREEHEERKEERREERKERRKEEEQRKEERREEREARKEKEESGRHEKHKHHHEDREEDRELRHHEKHRHHEEECDDCGREEHERHIRHHGCGKDDDGCDSKKYYSAHSENVYPFSGGDAKIHSMVEKLARAIAQPGDPVADDRLFFTAFAQNWCEKRTPGYAELLRMIDPHSPGKWRVNGPLMNYAKFAEAFSCPVGTPMNPEKKCVIW